MISIFLLVAVLLLHVVAAERNDFHDPARNNVFGKRFTFEDGEYVVSTIRTDWYAAANLCKAQGGELLSIESSNENAAVLSAIAGATSESFWTSGTEVYRNGNFYWSATGQDIDSFTYWGPNEPFATLEQCIALSSDVNYMWADQGCLLENHFICEFHPPCSISDSKSNQKINDTGAVTGLRFDFGNSSYTLVDYKASWVQAKNDCKKSGKQLVSIESIEENMIIMEAVIETYPDESIWTSGTDLGHEGNFYWEATGSSVGGLAHSNWAPGQPDNGQDGLEQCVELNNTWSHMWNDQRCDIELHFVCEWQPCNL